MLNKAIEIAAKAHAGQVDKFIESKPAFVIEGGIWK